MSYFQSAGYHIGRKGFLVKVKVVDGYGLVGQNTLTGTAQVLEKISPTGLLPRPKGLLGAGSGVTLRCCDGDGAMY